MWVARSVQAVGSCRVNAVGDATDRSKFQPGATMNNVMEVLGIALSGMQSAQKRVGVSAHNVANLLTEDFRPQRATQTSLASGGSSVQVTQSASSEPVSLEREIVGQIMASTQYSASARVFEVGAEMRGRLIDILG